MPAVKGHKNQVHVADAVQLGVRVRPDCRERAKQEAARLKISLNAYVDMLLDQVTLDEHGRAVLLDRQEVLPLKTA